MLPNKTRTAMWIAFVGALGLAGPALAVYEPYGMDMQEIAARELDNGAYFQQTVQTWLADDRPPKPYTNQAAFTLPACESVAWARLYTTVWAGTRDYTNTFSIYLQDTNHLLTRFSFGTTNDVSSAFQEDANNAYGTGFGVWFVSVPIDPGLLPVDGISTSVFITVVEYESGLFDGRQIHLTLAAVYRDRALNNRFSCRIAEGPADIYRNQAGATNRRSVAFSAVETNELLHATLHALYTYGDYNQMDRLYLNDQQYGTDDVADKEGNQSGFVADLASFAVTNLAISNAVRFSVNTNELAGTWETSLRPHLAVLAVTREPTPQLYQPVLSEEGVHLAWSASSGSVYRIEHTTNVIDEGSWTPVAGLQGLTGTNAMMSGEDPSARDGLRLYRLFRERP